MVKLRRISMILAASLLPSAAMAPAAVFIFQTIDAPGAIVTLAYDVNDFGTVVGYFQDAIGEHGYVFNNGVFSVIDFPGALYITQAMGINNAGQIVGSYQPPIGTGSRGFLGNTSTSAPIRDVNNLGQTVGTATSVSYPGTAMTFAEGLNDTGQITGGYVLDGTQHGFLDIDGVFASVDVPNSIYTIAFGINNANQIVGNFIDHGSPFHHGFFDNSGVFQTVDFPGAYETEIFGINNLGDIVGMYRDGSGEHGFIGWDPPALPVPEPSTVPILLSLVATLALVKLSGRLSSS